MIPLSNVGNSAALSGKRWRAEGEGASEDEMAGWHHRLNGHELGQTSGDGEGHLVSMRSQRVRQDWVTEQQNVQKKKGKNSLTSCSTERTKIL